MGRLSALCPALAAAGAWLRPTKTLSETRRTALLRIWLCVTSAPIADDRRDAHDDDADGDNDDRRDVQTASPLAMPDRMTAFLPDAGPVRPALAKPRSRAGRIGSAASMPGAPTDPHGLPKRLYDAAPLRCRNGFDYARRGRRMKKASVRGEAGPCRFARSAPKDKAKDPRCISRVLRFI